MSVSKVIDKHKNGVSFKFSTRFFYFFLVKLLSVSK